MSELEAAVGAEPTETTEVPVVVGQEEGTHEGAPAEETAKPELTEAEKAAKALKRRVDRLTRERYEERARHDAEVARLRESVAKPEGEAPQLTQEEVERRAEEKAKHIAEARAFNERCDKVFNDGKKLYPTFAEDLRTVASEVGPLFDKDNQPTTLMRSILDSEEPHKVFKYLADNPDVAAEIADLPERQQFRRLVKLETEIGEATRPKPSNAPKPVAPVRGGAASGSPDPDKDPQAWIDWRNKQARR